MLLASYKGVLSKNVRAPGNAVRLSDVATLNMPTSLHDFLSFYIIFQFRFGILKVATPGK